MAFTDSWVQDQILLQLLSDDGCSCCGLVAGVGMKFHELMQMCSDLDSDDAKSSFGSASPWPVFIRESLWTDRVRFRRALKASSADYTRLWREHGEQLTAYFEALPEERKREIFRLPLSAIHRLIAEQGFDSAYRFCLITLLEQLAKWPLTGYAEDGDGATEAEIGFELALCCADPPRKDAGERTFYLADMYLAESDLSSPYCLLTRFAETCSKLLEKRPKDEGEQAPAPTGCFAAAPDGGPAVVGSAQLRGRPLDVPALPKPAAPQQHENFRADRRLLRVLLLRAFVDRLVAAWRADSGAVAPVQEAKDASSPAATSADFRADFRDSQSTAAVGTEATVTPETRKQQETDSSCDEASAESSNAG